MKYIFARITPDGYMYATSVLRDEKVTIRTHYNELTPASFRRLLRLDMNLRFRFEWVHMPNGGVSFRVYRD